MPHSAAKFRYDPFSPEAMRDPHSLYPVLREEHPAYYIPEYDTWVFSRYQDVWDGFMDAEHYSEAEGQLFAPEVLRVAPSRQSAGAEDRAGKGHVPLARSAGADPLPPAARAAVPQGQHQPA